MGGAEIGLANMVRRGLFDQFDLHILTIWPPSERFLEENDFVRPYFKGSLLASKSRSALFLIPALIQFVRISRGLNSDIVVASLPQSSLITRGYKIFRPKTKIITFEHIENLGSAASTNMIRLTGWLVDGLWADSPTTLATTRKRHWYRRTVTSCVVSLLDLSDFLSSPVPIYQREVLNLLYVGRLAPQKNILSAIAAVKRVCREGMSVELDIVGDGELRGEISALVRGEAAIRLHAATYGWRRDWAGRPVVGLLVSLREGLSITALQLMALGFPLITTAAGEIGSYTSDEDNAWIASRHDEDAIVKAIQRAWTARSQWHDMGQSARASAIEYVHGRSAGADSVARKMLSTI